MKLCCIENWVLRLELLKVCIQYWNKAPNTAKSLRGYIGFFSSYDQYTIPKESSHSRTAEKFRQRMLNLQFLQFQLQLKWELAPASSYCLSPGTRNMCALHSVLALGSCVTSQPLRWELLVIMHLCHPLCCKHSSLLVSSHPSYPYSLLEWVIAWKVLLSIAVLRERECTPLLHGNFCSCSVALACGSNVVMKQAHHRSSLLPWLSSF